MTAISSGVLGISVVSTYDTAQPKKRSVDRNKIGDLFISWFSSECLSVGDLLKKASKLTLCLFLLALRSYMNDVVERE